MSNKILFRPPWTCGKYNAEKHVAIMFNLLSRMNYFYESDSADVVGAILQAGKYGAIYIEEVSRLLDIAPKSLSCFFTELCNEGLLSSEQLTEEAIHRYRESVKNNTGTTRSEEAVSRHFEDIEKDTPYMAYAKTTKDRMHIFDAMFELTYRCSEKCIHCYNPGATRNDSERNGRANTVELSLNDYKRIIDNLCEAGLTTAVLTGGDPFSNPNVWNIIEYLYQKDIAISIYTNGLSLKGQEKKLAGYFPQCVQFSLYSGDATVHDSITRTKGSFEKTIAVMEELHKFAIPIDIACPIIQPNLKSYFLVKPYMEKYGSNCYFDLMITDSIDGDKCASQHLRLTPEQMEVVLLDQDVIQHVPINVSTIDEDAPIGNPEPHAPCGAMLYSYNINPNGNLTPCSAFPLVLGNLKEKSIQEIVNGNKLIGEWSSTRESDYEECFTHDYCDYCYFCPGNNYNDRGSRFKAGENNCYLAKIRYATIQKLKNGIDILNGKKLTERISELDVEIPQLNREYNRANGVPKNS